MRDLTMRMGGDPKRINPLMPADLIIDHSVQVDRFATASAYPDNVAREYGRNGERYAFLRWGKESFRNFRVVPPGTGICHQVNLESLAPVVFTRKDRSGAQAYPDTLVGTDSHTPMINGLGVVGGGGGGVGAGGGTIGFFPVDRETLSYLLFTGRDREQVKLVEAYCKAQGLFRTDDTRDPAFSDTLSMDLSTVEPCMAGPRRPQDRVPLKEARDAFREALSTWGKEARTENGADGADRWMGEGGYAAGQIHTPEAGGWTPGTTSVRLDQGVYDLHDGSGGVRPLHNLTNSPNPPTVA